MRNDVRKERMIIFAKVDDWRETEPSLDYRSKPIYKTTRQEAFKKFVIHCARESVLKDFKITSIVAQCNELDGIDWKDLIE